MDMGPYYLSAIVALLGPSRASRRSAPGRRRSAASIPARRQAARWPVETPTHYSAVLGRLCSGAAVNLNLSFDVYRSNLPLFEIYGDEGTLTYPDPNLAAARRRSTARNSSPTLSTARTPRPKARSERFYPHARLFTRAKDYSRGIGVLDLARAIETGQTARTGGALLLHVTEAMAACCRPRSRGVSTA